MLVGFALCGNTGETTETHSCGTIKEIAIGACWYGVNETHRNVLNEDLPWNSKERGKQAWPWRESDNGSVTWFLSCYLVLHRLWASHRLSNNCDISLVWLKTNPTCSGGPWFCTSDFRISLCAFLRNAERGLQYLSWQMSVSGSHPEPRLGSHEFCFCSVAIMVFPGNAWVFSWKFKDIYTHLSCLDSR